MEILIGLAAGAVFAALIFLAINYSNKKANSANDIEQLAERLKEAFGAISMETLKSQNELAGKELENKKVLIDQRLEDMTKHMEKVTDLVKTLEKDREQKFGELTNHLKTSVEQTSKLHETTNQLHAALSNTKVRGQWGERMAEDVLRLAGFLEGINYIKQKELDGSKGRPDYTFFLPQDLKVNMDVKFPLDNYLNYLNAEGGDEAKYKSLFLKDVKQRIKEVASKDYINPADKTVDYMIVFIPNEQVYSFIQESDNTILDVALQNRVILCSPLTLYAILAIIRQAVDNFKLESAAAEILSLLGQFNNQWGRFLESLDKLGKNLSTAQKTFDELSTTRVNQLQRPLGKIEEIRKQRALESTEVVAIQPTDENIIPLESEPENPTLSS